MIRNVLIVLSGVVVLVFADACSRENKPASAPERSVAPVSDTAPVSASANAGITRAWRLVMIGNSITAGFGLPPDEALPTVLQERLRSDNLPVEVINAGVSGDTTADALDRFDWSVDADADAVLIALGGNDLLQGIDPSKTRAHLVAMIEKAEARGLSVILAGLRAPGNYGKDYQNAFNDLYSSVATQMDVYFYPDFLRQVAGNTKLNQADGIHPNPDGVAIIADRLTAYLGSEFAEQIRAASVSASE